MKPNLAASKRKSLIRLVIVLAGIFESVLTEIVEVCILENQQISCPRDSVIFVTSAEYGRMEVGRCIKKEDEFLGCTNDVLSAVDKWCSGKEKCNLEAGKLESANTNCLDILMKYLKVEYTCVQTETQCAANQPNILRKESGFLSSFVLDKKGCGSSRSPWIISASPGQTIQIDIVDFAVNKQDYSLISCGSVYGFIVERSLGINYTICGGQSRQRALYTSKTNSVEIHLISNEKREKSSFLLKYSVAGCPEINRPQQTWYKREGNQAVIGCENNDKEWRLQCVDNTWTGSFGNCSQMIPPLKEEEIQGEIFHISSIVVISGIAGAAVVLSVIAIVSGVVYVNRYRMKQELKRANLYKTYSTIGSNLQAYYRPVTVDQSENTATSWDMSLLPANQMTLLSEKCTCPTLQMRNQGERDKTEGDRSLERQSLYSSIRST